MTDLQANAARALSGIYAVLAEAEPVLYDEEIRIIQSAADIIHKLERRGDRR